MDKLLEIILKNRGIVLVLLAGILCWGYHSYKNIPRDAFPDISPVMVPIFCEADGLAAQEVEEMISQPVEAAMSGLPDVTLVKSTSAFGLSVVYVYFKDDVNIYFARQLVSERLASMTNQLPSNVQTPELGPISTGLGQIFIYYLEADKKIVNTQGKPLDSWLRELNDFVVKRQLQTVPGVTAILSMGGHCSIRYSLMPMRCADMMLLSAMQWKKFRKTTATSAASIWKSVPKSISCAVSDDSTQFRISPT